jgi:hypothetical protein
MSLFTKTQTKQLIANCQAQVVRMNSEQPDIGFKPVVELFTIDAQCAWLLTELDSSPNRRNRLNPNLRLWSGSTATALIDQLQLFQVWLRLTIGGYHNGSCRTVRACMSVKSISTVLSGKARRKSASTRTAATAPAA